MKNKMSIRVVNCLSGLVAPNGRLALLSIWEARAGLAFFCSFLSVCGCSKNQDGSRINGERIYLWQGTIPDYQSHQYAEMFDVASEPGFDRDSHRIPYVEWFEPAITNGSGVCLVLISGGSYTRCLDCELIRKWITHFTGKGYPCANLVYRTPRPGNGLPFYQSAWEDGQRAIRIVRKEVVRRGYDPEKIGTLSMSAGSHLATLLATSSLTPAYAKIDEIDDIPCHVNFAITGSVAYGLTDGRGCPNVQGGYGIGVELDSAFKFDVKTAPMCLLHGDDDPYSPIASVRLYEELSNRGIMAELHLYKDVGHSFEQLRSWPRICNGFIERFATRSHDLSSSGCDRGALDRWKSSRLMGIQADCHIATTFCFTEVDLWRILNDK